MQNSPLEMIALRTLGVALLLYSAQGALCHAETSTDLQQAINRFAQGAHPLTKSEIDVNSCAPVDDNPSVVVADFDADGRTDYALLLNLGETGKEVDWNGSRLKQARIALVFLLADDGGGFKARVAHRFVSYLPAASVLRLLPPGTVTDRETNKKVRLGRPAVGLAMCEKSATAYSITKDRRIRAVPLLD